MKWPLQEIEMIGIKKCQYLRVRYLQLSLTAHGRGTDHATLDHELVSRK